MGESEKKGHHLGNLRDFHELHENFTLQPETIKHPGGARELEDLERLQGDEVDANIDSERREERFEGEGGKEVDPKPEAKVVGANRFKVLQDPNVALDIVVENFHGDEKVQHD